MPKPDKYVPTHRAPGKHKAARVPRRALRTTVALTGLAAAATGVSVAGGLLGTDPAALTPAAADVATSSPEASAEAGADTSSAASTPTLSADQTAAELEQRQQRQVVSRSARRTDATKATTLTMSAGAAVTRSQKLSEGDPRDIAQALLPVYGFSSDQFSCLDSLYMSESGWRIDADNPTSSAYGIPQALTGLHDMPEGYMTSAEVQIRWGLEYIQDTYGTPCSAWSFKQGNGWY
ncbi:lytic transglycosylase domain-containing protein [Nocardioides oleivorans]|uniref:Lytic transglycosylase domain-containing protein n=1 Tax=Nocardioides oleivorans TaxID=273676 RepID=A0A4Q2S070_9ACTN|nr:lytic transglycosylase domain-containing protein [Nocardioides oleivorans]RYB94991.1 lytic transglycosylase domain-containing protein [Nocardioides oleivorans]